MRSNHVPVLKNVLMKDGKARRVPTDRADELIESGQAKRFISNTIYRAMKLGIEITNFNDRDEKGKLKERIQAARNKVSEKQKNTKKDGEAE